MYENYINYNYNKLTADLKRLSGQYPLLHIDTFGRSVEKRELLRIRMGKGRNHIHLNGAHHGMEWITSALLVQFVSDLADCVMTGRSFCGENASRLLSACTLDIVPMVNPDGVEYAQQHKKLNWQSNANGVDLNHNYPAKFYEGKLLEEETGILGPCASRFSGFHPLDQPETYSMSKLICAEVPNMVIAFHAQGKEIYYEFDGKQHKEALCIAYKLADAAGYEVSIPDGFSSYSGMKDWVIDRFRIPAFTVEVGEGENPLPMEQFPQILEDNCKLIVKAMKV